MNGPGMNSQTNLNSPVVMPYLDVRLFHFEAPDVTTITIESYANCVPHPDPSEYRAIFTGMHKHQITMGTIGYNKPQEAPQAFAQVIFDIDGR